MGWCAARQWPLRNDRVARVVPVAELMKAAAAGEVATIQRLLLEGAVPIDAVERGGVHAVHYAACRGQAGALSALLEAGADPNSATHAGKSGRVG